METEGDTVIRVISVCRHMEVEDNLFSKDRDRTDYLINGVKRKQKAQKDAQLNQNSRENEFEDRGDLTRRILMVLAAHLYNHISTNIEPFFCFVINRLTSLS